MCRYHGVAEAEAREAFKKLGVVSENHATDSYKGYDPQGETLIPLNRFSLYRVRKLPGINSPTSGSNISPRTSRPQPETLFSEKLPSNSLCLAENRPTYINIYYIPLRRILLFIQLISHGQFTRAPDYETSQALFVRQRIIKCKYLIS